MRARGCAGANLLRAKRTEVELIHETRTTSASLPRAHSRCLRSVPPRNGIRGIRKEGTPMVSTEPGTRSGAIELAGVTKTFATPGGSYTALRDLDLTVAPGEFCAVVGPTGCGKSTTLTLVSGLERPTQGTVRVHGEPVSGVTPGVGFMFHTDAILPWKTVIDNVSA